MFPIQSLARTAAAVVRTEGSRRGLARYGEVVVGRPTVRISFPEKMVHMGLLFVGILGYPIYAMFEVAKIKQAEYDQLEMPEEN